MFWCLKGLLDLELLGIMSQFFLRIKSWVLCKDRYWIFMTAGPQEVSSCSTHRLLASPVSEDV